MSEIMKRAGDRVHDREIRMSAYEAGDSHVIIEGFLEDRRLYDYYVFSGGTERAGLLHSMTVRMLVQFPQMIIEDVEAEITEYPRDECPSALAAVSSIKGMKIGPGFAEEINAQLGGVKSCAHIVQLIRNMAFVLFQGLSTSRARRPFDDVTDWEVSILKKIVTDTCLVWKKGGKALQDIDADFEKIRSRRRQQGG